MQVSKKTHDKLESFHNVHQKHTRLSFSHVKRVGNPTEKTSEIFRPNRNDILTTNIILSKGRFSLLPLLSSVPKDINSNNQDAPDDEIYGPLPAHVHDLFFIVSDKISNIRKNTHPDTSTESSIKTEFHEVHSTQPCGK